MAEQTPKIFEVEVDSTNLTHTVRHELIFSITKRWFVKPAYSKRSQGKLVYRLLPGNYIKFSLFISKKKDYAVITLTHIHIDQNGIEYKDILEYKTTYTDVMNIPDDINAPYTLAYFIKVMPHYHQTARLDIINYSISETAQELVEEIRNYLQMRGVSQ